MYAVSFEALFCYRVSLFIAVSCYCTYTVSSGVCVGRTANEATLLGPPLFPLPLPLSIAPPRDHESRFHSPLEFHQLSCVARCFELVVLVCLSYRYIRSYRDICRTFISVL